MMRTLAAVLVGIALAPGIATATEQETTLGPVTAVVRLEPEAPVIGDAIGTARRVTGDGSVVGCGGSCTVSTPGRCLISLSLSTGTNASTRSGPMTRYNSAPMESRSAAIASGVRS